MADPKQSDDMVGSCELEHVPIQIFKCSHSSVSLTYPFTNLSYRPHLLDDRMVEIVFTDTRRFLWNTLSCLFKLCGRSKLKFNSVRLTRCARNNKNENFLSECIGHPHKLGFLDIL